MSADVDRCERAKELLRSGMPVREIAENLGYRSTGIFRRAFRDQIGSYPYAWLKQHGCPTSIGRDDLDNLVLWKVADELLTPARVQEIVTRADQMQMEARGTASTRVRQLKRQLAAAKLRESNLWELAEDQGLAARAGFRARLDVVQQEVAELGRLVSVQEQVIERSIRPLSPTEAARSARQMRQLLLEASLKQKRSFVRSIIEKVIVKNDVIEIIGPELTIAEVANDEEDGFRPPVRSFGREWLTSV